VTVLVAEWLATYWLRKRQQLLDLSAVVHLRGCEVSAITDLLGISLCFQLDKVLINKK
jgi:hypothetical protein